MLPALSFCCLCVGAFTVIAGQGTLGTWPASMSCCTASRTAARTLLMMGCSSSGCFCGAALSGLWCTSLHCP